MNAVLETPVRSWMRVDVDHNQAIINGRRIDLTPQQTEILSFMWANRTRVLHPQRIIAAVNGADYWQMTEGSLRCQISKMRIKLAPDCVIKNYLERGYQPVLR